MQQLKASVLVLAVLSALAHAYYLPGVMPKNYIAGDPVELKVNRLTSEQMLLPFSYYDLAYCRPERMHPSSENLGEILRGDRIYNSPYEVRFRAKQRKAVACSLRCVRLLACGNWAFARLRLLLFITRLARALRADAELPAQQRPRAPHSKPLARTHAHALERLFATCARLGTRPLYF